MSLLIVSAGQKFLIWLFYGKSSLVVVDFELKKFSLGNLTKNFFQSSLGLILLNWGLAEERVPPNSFCKRKIYYSGCSTKNVLRMLSDFEHKTFSFM